MGFDVIYTNERLSGDSLSSAAVTGSQRQELGTR
jgi:hypothetical protein